MLLWSISRSGSTKRAPLKGFHFVILFFVLYFYACVSALHLILRKKSFPSPAFCSVLDPPNSAFAFLLSVVFVTTIKNTPRIPIWRKSFLGAVFSTVTLHIISFIFLILTPAFEPSAIHIFCFFAHLFSMALDISTSRSILLRT